MSHELVDFEIEELVMATGMVYPFKESLLNPNSLDVRLSGDMMYEINMSFYDYWERKMWYDPYHYEWMVRQGNCNFIKMRNWTKDNPFSFKPNDFMLGSTIEKFNLPQNIRAQFHLKSSRAREGYGHSLAGFCDPGWTNSNLTLELKNSTAHTELDLYEGLLIGQMVFTQLDVSPRKRYTEIGHYNNDKGTQPSRMGEKATA